MQFSNFSTSVEGLTITFYNEMPIENVGTIKYFKDNVTGLFAKKEFRWSFNNEYWSAWETLTQNGVSMINTHGNYYFFLQVRYTKSTINSGNVSSFILNYTQGSAVPVTPRILADDIQCCDASAILIHDVIQQYKIIPITDASLLNGYPGKYYLDRSHHTGYQPISSITNLQNILNQLISASGVTQLYVDGSLAARDASIAWLINQHYLKESSIGTGFVWNNGYLDVSGGGKDYDASIYYLTTYVEDLSTRISTLTITVEDLSTYVSALDASSLKGVINVGGGAGEIFKQITNQEVELRTIAPATSGVSVTVVGDQIRIGLDASITGETVWTDPDPISADVGGWVGGDDVSLNSNSISILEKMLYEYFPPNIILNLDPSPGYYEKWNPAVLADVSIYGSFNNDDFVKVRISDVSVYATGLGGFGHTSYADVSAGTFAFNDGGFNSNWDDTVYTIKVYNKVGGIYMPTADASAEIKFTLPYIWGVVNTPETITATTLQNFHSLGQKVIVPKQSNQIEFIRPSGIIKARFVYAYDANYGDLRNIFDVQNDFNVTSSFDAPITINITLGAQANIPYKVYVKSHWIDVSTFKLIFNI